MQLPELFRQGVVRPLDAHAAQQLAAFNVENSIRVEWIPVLGDQQFGDIWNTGVLQHINDMCGTMISDYEEVELKASQIGEALKAVRSAAVGNTAATVFIQKLEALLREASATNNSVYFVF